MGGELIEAEHVARYRLAAQLARGKRILDAGCGVGWGCSVLLEAGAVSVAGVDIAADVVRNARQREPRANFVSADLHSLPFSRGAFDLISCFEAIEHVTDPWRVLDELARVLAPSGTLLISSPNPRVYPPGNEFHIHEFTPEELCEEASARFFSVALWNQYELLASVIVDEGSRPLGEPLDVEVRPIVPLTGDFNPYSVVAATNGTMPPIRGVSLLAPSQHSKLAAAHQVLYENQLALEKVAARASDAYHHAVDEVASLRQRVERLRRDVDLARRDRDHTGVLLLEAEQRAALLLQELDATSGVLHGQLRDLHYEIDTLHASTSWRATAWMRKLSGVLRNSG